MQKRVGIVVAAVAATLLVLSPFAYAGSDPAQREQVPPPIGENGRDNSQRGLVNLGDVNALNGLNVCPDVTAAVGLGNVLGILGIGVGAADAADGTLTCTTDNSGIDKSNGAAGG